MQAYVQLADCMTAGLEDVGCSCHAENLSDRVDRSKTASAHLLVKLMKL
jgi:hypothetical protein